jgi:hypothetical protein
MLDSLSGQRPRYIIPALGRLYASLSDFAWLVLRVTVGGSLIPHGMQKLFIGHLLPKGEMTHRGKAVDLGAIRRCAIMAVEGEKDDISGVGQTLAALDLTPNLPSGKKAYHLQNGAGHYGVFNGSRFRGEIVPRIAAFIRTQDQAASRPARAAASERTRSDPNASGGRPNAARLRARAQPAQLAPAFA